MFEPTDWSDSVSSRQTVRGLAVDVLMHLMVGFEGNSAWRLP